MWIYRQMAFTSSSYGNNNDFDIDWDIDNDNDIDNENDNDNAPPDSGRLTACPLPQERG